MMADRTRRVPDNRPGPYYVDRECIDCDLCRELAPENFQRNEDEGYSYVHKQPESDQERERCEEARDSCPVEAIGQDGQVDAPDGAESPTP